MNIPITPKSDLDEITDYFELRTLLDADQSTSIMQAISDVTMGGEDSAWEETDQHRQSNFQQEQEDLAYDALDFIERRRSYAHDSYPFKVEKTRVVLDPKGLPQPYIFLLLLSFLSGKAPDHDDAAKFFEELSAIAAAAYLGADHQKEAYVFGFPRRVGPRGFSDALRYLCGKDLLNEGSQLDSPKSEMQKDARLDIVAWRNFPDRKRGRLILFGQCATGANWEEKTYALNPNNWRNSWLNEPFLPIPVGAFFVPHVVRDDSWRSTLCDGGLLFDRFRIAAISAHLLSIELQQQLAVWSTRALESIRNQS